MTDPRTTSRWMPAAVTALLGAVLLTAACARHEAEPVFRSSISIGDRGISVPLPPPSLFEAPKQSVDVHVQIDGDGMLSAGTELKVIDLEGDVDETFAVMQGEETLTLEGLALDLSNNCLELWLVLDGTPSQRSHYHAVIGADGQSVETVPGCDEAP